MRFISVSLIVFFFIFIANITIASAQKDRSRRPETEAEIALDRILQTECDVTDENKHVFTKKFVEDFKKQICQAVPNYKECVINFPKNFDYDFYPWSANPIECSQDSLYGQVQNPYGELFEETNCNNSKNSCYIRMEDGIYYMKIEDGEWKIDGIACSNNYILLNVNRKLTYPAT